MIRTYSGRYEAESNMDRGVKHFRSLRLLKAQSHRRGKSNQMMDFQPDRVSLASSTGSDSVSRTSSRSEENERAANSQNGRINGWMEESKERKRIVQMNTYGVKSNAVQNGAPSGVQYGASNVQNGVMNCFPNGIPNGVPTGSVNGFQNGSTNGVPTGFANGVPNGSTNAVPTGFANGVPTGFANGVPTGFANGVPNGFANDAPNGFANGVPNGFANGVPNGASNGSPNGIPNGTMHAHGGTNGASQSNAGQNGLTKVVASKEEASIIKSAHLSNEFVRLTEILEDMDGKDLKEILQMQLRKKDGKKIVALSMLLPKQDFPPIKNMHCVRCHRNFNPRQATHCTMRHPNASVIKRSHDAQGADFHCRSCKKDFRIIKMHFYDEAVNSYMSGFCFSGHHTANHKEVEYGGNVKSCEQSGCLELYV